MTQRVLTRTLLRLEREGLLDRRVPLASRGH